MRRLFTARIGLILALTTFFAASSVFSAGVDITGIGARAQALGGNYRAIANDWSAMFWNPAGMAFTEGVNMGLSLELITPVSGYTAAKSLAGQQFSATYPTERKNEPKTFIVPAAGIYMNKGRFAFGIGFWAPFGLGAKWDLLDTEKYNKQFPKYEFEDDLQIVDLHPSVAYKISDKLSVGAGLSIIYAKIWIHKPNFTPNPYIYSDELKSNLLIKNFLQYTMPKDALDSPYDHLITDTNLEGTGSGIGANFGLMFKPTSTLSIGISANYYPTIPLTGTVDATTYYADHPEANEKLQPVKKLAFDPMYQKGELTDEEYAALALFYSGGTNVLAKGLKLKADLPLPMRVGGGIAYTGIPNLLISADVAWTQWSVWDVIELKNEQGEAFSALVEKWRDSIRAGFGLEYSLNTIKLRGAFYSEPNAAIPATMAPTIPDISRRNTVTIGFEYPVGPFRLHASYEKIFLSDLTVDQWVLEPDGNGYENMAGRYTMNVNNVMFGLDYRF